MISLEEHIIRLEQVTKSYPTEPPVVALDSVDLVVSRGEQLAVVGPSGSGKSTLLNVIGCLDRPTSGTYCLDGVEVGTLGDRELARLRCERIGFVFQSFHLLEHRSVVDNVALGQLYDRRHAPSGGRLSRRVRRERAAELLERVGLGHRLDFRPNKLSGGERQRVAIARALMGSPGLLLCDEPTGNLDSSNTGSILDLFTELRSSGLTLVIITHDLEVARRGTRQVVISDGQLREPQGALHGTR